MIVFLTGPLLMHSERAWCDGILTTMVIIEWPKKQNLNLATISFTSTICEEFVILTESS